MSLLFYEWASSVSGVIFISLVIVICISYGHFHLGLCKGKHSFKQRCSFTAGCLLLVLVKGSPLSYLEHLSMSMHMLYLSLFLFVIPPILLAGFPEKYLHDPGVKTFRKWPSFCCLFFFSLLLFLWHLPFFQLWLLFHSFVQAVLQWCLFGLSICVWHSIRKNNRNPAKYFLTFTYMGLSSLFILPSCLFLISYPLFYDRDPWSSVIEGICLSSQSYQYLFPFIIKPRMDSQMAGIIMFMIHKGSMAGATAFFRLLRNNEVR